jgi:hypothetical protein
VDTRFQPAVQAIKSGDAEKLRELIGQDPSLATARSTVSHPTLLQCLVLDGNDLPNKVEMAKILVDAGAEINEPLTACGSCDNVEVAELLLDRGAEVNGIFSWSPLEEALYWHQQRAAALFLRRGATIHNLRIAAALGRTDPIAKFFEDDGRLKESAGKINWPWYTRNPWTSKPQDILDNAFVYACMHGHIDAAQLLLDKGAQINAIPEGFDFAGTGLHYAALNGHQPMVEFLIAHGADPTIKDTKVASTPAGWAEHAGHHDLKRYLLGLT